jgi:hypothetical protein
MQELKLVTPVSKTILKKRTITGVAGYIRALGVEKCIFAAVKLTKKLLAA